MSFQGFAPRFVGEFEKGVDYKGERKTLEDSVIEHAVLARAHGGYKISVHSGSDKFSIYGPIRRALARFGAGVHLKTAGTTWLEAVVGPRRSEHRYRRGQGCSHCNGRGYSGRTGVYEMLEMTPDLVRAANRADPNEFLEAARPHLRGHTLTDRALALVFAGKTTVAEAMKVAVQLEE